MPEDRRSYEEGWPARDFSEEARSYLLHEARQRVQEQLAQVRSYDVKIAALFTASAGLFALSGFLGSLRIEATPEGVLTLMTVSASLIAWILLGIAYWLRRTGVGLDMQAIRDYYAKSGVQELQDAALESLVEDFILNQRTIRSKALWLKWSLIAVAAQLLLLFAATVADTVAGNIEAEAQPPTTAEHDSLCAILINDAREGTPTRFGRLGR